MCGIAGFFSTEPSDTSIIEIITNSLAHRGPDASGCYKNNLVALGHRRLSIIDLDARANQPFYSGNGRYVMVYNGEIYNYQAIASELQQEGVSLKTTSDTEVVIESFNRWGVGSVHKLKGMFAYTIYDTMEERLYLFRDRVGKKPLYYFLNDSLFVFASEIKALLAHPEVKAGLTVKKQTIAAFLQLGYIQQPQTFYENIYKFPAGHYGIIGKGLKLSLFPYWDIARYLKASHTTTEPQALRQLQTKLEESINDRLIADVPVGIFLSGGIDSSLVTAIASKSKKLKTFSIGFKENKFDESVYAEKIASYLGTDHQRHILQERDAVNMVEQYLHHFDEPFADTSSIPTMLVSQVARKEVTVALTGDGGDELFLGYGSYTWANRLANPAIKTLRPVIKTLMNAVPSPRWKRAAHLFEKTREGKQRRHIFSQEQYFFSDTEIREHVLRDNQYYFDWPYDDFRYLKVLSEAERQALFDFQFYLRDDLLVKVDRASMYYGLECRCPLLDHSLVEFVYNLPENLRKRGNESKYLLKRVLFDMVPQKYFDRPKWGFSIPLAQWLKNDLNYLMDYLSEEHLDKTAVFNTPYIRSLVNRFYKGEDYLYNRLWVVIITQRFLIQHV